MKLKQLVLENIGRYATETIEFNLDTLALIVGQNGAGKSTIFDSVLWTIFGKTSKETTIDEIVRLGEDRGQVDLTLVDDDHEYIISRVRNVKKQVTQLSFFVDGTDYSGAILSETESKIQQHLKTDFVTFRNSIFFGQEEVNQFVKGTDKERKDVLTKFLNLEVYDKALEKVKTLKTEVSAKLSAIIQSKTQLEAQYQNIESIEKIIADQTKNYEDLKKVRDEEIIKARATLTTAQARVTELQQKVAYFTSLEASRTKIQEFYNAVRSKQDEIQVCRTNLNQISTTGICPTCAQKMNTSVTQKTRQAIILRGNTLVKEIEKIFIEINIPEIKDFQALAKFLEKLNTELSDAQRVREDLVIQQQLVLQNNEQTIMSNYATQLSSIETLLESQKKIVEGCKTFKDDVTALDTQIKDNELLLEKLKKLEVVFGPNGIKTAVIENVVSSLEDKINNIVNKFTSGISVSLETQVQGKTGKLKEKFAIYVNDLSGKREFRTYSGGEKRSISVAIRFAFAELALERSSSLLEFLLLDEVTDAFDETRKEAFYTLLEDLRLKYNQILIISHDTMFKDMFSEVIEVTKNTHGVSQIVTEI